jgi:hypothetical protein
MVLNYALNNALIKLRGFCRMSHDGFNENLYKQVIKVSIYCKR